MLLVTVPTVHPPPLHRQTILVDLKTSETRAWTEGLALELKGVTCFALCLLPRSAIREESWISHPLKLG